MNFDEIFDLPAGVYYHFFNIALDTRACLFHLLQSQNSSYVLGKDTPGTRLQHASARGIPVGTTCVEQQL